MAALKKGHGPPRRRIHSHARSLGSWSWGSWVGVGRVRLLQLVGLIAGGLTFPPSVLGVFGGWAYWFENANGQTASQPARLRAIQVSGGCGGPVTIDSVASDAGAIPFPTNLAYDGTDVYWTHGESGSGGQGLSIVKAPLGSATQTAVATSSSEYLSNAFTNGLLYTSGNLYLNANGTGLLKVPTSGGTLTPVQPPSGVFVSQIWTTDGTNLFFEQDSNSGAPTFYVAPLSLASAPLLATAPSANTSGGLAVSNGNAYMLSYSSSGSPQTSQLAVASVGDALDGGGSGGVAQFSDFAGVAVVADERPTAWPSTRATCTGSTSRACTRSRGEHRAGAAHVRSPRLVASYERACGAKFTEQELS